MPAAVLINHGYIVYLKGGPLAETVQGLPYAQGRSLDELQELMILDEQRRFLDVYRFEKIVSIVIHYQYVGRARALVSAEGGSARLRSHGLYCGPLVGS
jgi:hypothetical protein